MQIVKNIQFRDHLILCLSNHCGELLNRHFEEAEAAAEAEEKAEERAEAADFSSVEDDGLVSPLNGEKRDADETVKTVKMVVGSRQQDGQASLTRVSKLPSLSRATTASGVSGAATPALAAANAVESELRNLVASFFEPPPPNSRRRQIFVVSEDLDFPAGNACNESALLPPFRAAQLAQALHTRARPSDIYL